jgi:hypothetical protein
MSFAMTFVDRSSMSWQRKATVPVNMMGFYTIQIRNLDVGVCIRNDEAASTSQYCKQFGSQKRPIAEGRRGADFEGVV